MGTGFIIFAIGTIVLSITAELTNELRLFKDIADAGYIKKRKKYHNWHLFYTLISLIS